VVYFACEGQMQRFVQGQNPGEHVWDNASDAPAPAFLQVRFLFLTSLLVCSCMHYFIKTL